MSNQCPASMQTGFSLVLLLCLLSIAGASVIAANQDAPAAYRPVFPSPQLEPTEVVRIQVEALRTNTWVNEGIELTFSFASPKNKEQTGPLKRFASMVLTPPYDQLLNHKSVHYGSMQIAHGMALQKVSVTNEFGEETAYAWVLSLQTEGRHSGCWMTDAVIPLGVPVKRRLT